MKSSTGTAPPNYIIALLDEIKYVKILLAREM
jgi:hypothetical protein